MRIGLHKGSLHVARLLTLCTFAIAYANQGQPFTVDSLASFASAFDWHKPTACFLTPAALSSRAPSIFAAHIRFAASDFISAVRNSPTPARPHSLHVGPSAFLSARPDGHCLQHDGREPGSPDRHACSLAYTRPHDPRLCQRPPFPQMSPQHCRPKGRLLNLAPLLENFLYQLCSKDETALGRPARTRAAAGRLYACTSAFSGLVRNPEEG